MTKTHTHLGGGEVASGEGRIGLGFGLFSQGMRLNLNAAERVRLVGFCIYVAEQKAGNDFGFFGSALMNPHQDDFT